MLLREDGLGRPAEPGLATAPRPEPGRPPRVPSREPARAPVAEQGDSLPAAVSRHAAVRPQPAPAPRTHSDATPAGDDEVFELDLEIEPEPAAVPVAAQEVLPQRLGEYVDRSSGRPSARERGRQDDEGEGGWLRHGALLLALGVILAGGALLFRVHGPGGGEASEADYLPPGDEQYAVSPRDPAGRAGPNAPEAAPAGPSDAPRDWVDPELDRGTPPIRDAVLAAYGGAFGKIATIAEQMTEELGGIADEASMQRSSDTMIRLAGEMAKVGNQMGDAAAPNACEVVMLAQGEGKRLRNELGALVGRLEALTRMPGIGQRFSAMHQQYQGQQALFDRLLTVTEDMLVVGVRFQDPGSGEQRDAIFGAIQEAVDIPEVQRSLKASLESSGAVTVKVGPVVDPGAFTKRVRLGKATRVEGRRIWLDVSDVRPAAAAAVAQ
jgi:hypothetical protein